MVRRVEELKNLIKCVIDDTSSEQMINAFNQKEATLTETELGLASLRIGLRIEQEGNYPEKALYFANKALKALDKDNTPTSLVVAFTLHLMGSVHLWLHRFRDSIGYLDRANRILGRLQNEEGFSLNDVDPVLNCVQLWLAKAYVAGQNYKEALPFCLKALELHEDLGQNSETVAYDRKLLGDIYSGLGEHKKALKQNVLAQRIFRNRSLNSDLSRAKIDAVNMMIALGRCDEAVGTMKNLVKQMDEGSEIRALALISMAQALCKLEKFGECKRYLEISLGILEKREQKSSVEVADAYAGIWVQYEAMNEYETAISLLKRTLALLEECPKELHRQGGVSGKIGILLLLTDKYQQAIPYFESAIERFKYSCGPRHFKVGQMYNNLGIAYLELDRPQQATEMFALAKDIMDASLGLHHADSIAACHNLSKAHEEMGSYELAVEFQQLVVNGRESHGTSAENELREANKVLEELKKKASDASANESPKIALS